MKKILALTLALSLMLLAVGCGRKPDVPTLDEIKNSYYTDDEIEFALRRATRAELNEAWGAPDRTLEWEREDIWVLDEGRVLVVSYTLCDTVDDAEIED